MKPVLLAYSGPGQGHKMAAMALREAFLAEKAPVVCLDTLTTAMPFFRFLYAGLYKGMTRHAHHHSATTPPLVQNRPDLYAFPSPLKDIKGHIKCYEDKQGLYGS